jgi:hypothetical protein
LSTPWGLGGSIPPPKMLIVSASCSRGGGEGRLAESKRLQLLWRARDSLDGAGVHASCQQLPAVSQLSGGSCQAGSCQAASSRQHAASNRQRRRPAAGPGLP